MKHTGFICRAAMVFALGLLFGGRSNADLLSISGTFGTQIFVGPLNGGHFSGYFESTLPASNTIKVISTYHIDLYDSSSFLFETLTGDQGVATYIPTPSCQIGSGKAGPCLAYTFWHASVFYDPTRTSFLQLIAPVGFVGGATIPYDTTNTTGIYVAFAGIQGNSYSANSIVTSGTITRVEPIPEPASFILVGSLLLAGSLLMRTRNPG